MSPNIPSDCRWMLPLVRVSEQLFIPNLLDSGSSLVTTALAWTVHKMFASDISFCCARSQHSTYSEWAGNVVDQPLGLWLSNVWWDMGPSCIEDWLYWPLLLSGWFCSPSYNRKFWATRYTWQRLEHCIGRYMKTNVISSILYDCRYMTHVSTFACVDDTWSTTPHRSTNPKDKYPRQGPYQSPVLI